MTEENKIGSKQCSVAVIEALNTPFRPIILSQPRLATLLMNKNSKPTIGEGKSRLLHLEKPVIRCSLADIFSKFQDFKMPEKNPFST